MKLRLRRWMAALACVVVHAHALGAEAGRSTSVNATVGAAFDSDSIYVGLLEARTEVIEHLSLAAALAHLNAGGGRTEGQLRLMATGSWGVRQWAIENRHLVSFSTASVERYRIRVRAARSGLLGVGALSIRAFDEAFFDFDQSRLVRNNVALGAGLQLNPALTAELYRVWEGNRGLPDNRYVLALVTVRF